METCKKCVLPNTFPGIVFDSDGVCNFCNEHKQKDNKKGERLYATPDELMRDLEKYQNHDGPYDVLVPLSGGVDSSFALIELVEKYKLRPLAFHNDHGYEPETATNNVRRLCKKLGVDLLLIQQDYDFMKSLWKHVNNSKVEGLTGCYVCGNILYANALELAGKYKIPLIINGYSKGQVETVKGSDKGVIWIGEFLQEVGDRGDFEFVQKFLEKMAHQKKQKKYLSRHDLEQPVDPEKIFVIPFFVFRFYQTDKDKLKAICLERFDWEETLDSYPRRTTNCQMNWLNNYYDIKKLNYGNYHAEYSVLIRSGEISREQAVEDLRFEPSLELLQYLSKEVGMNPSEIKI